MCVCVCIYIIYICVCVCVYIYISVSFLKRLRNDRFASETANWIQKWFKISAGVDMPYSKIGTTLGNKKGSLLNYGR